MDDFQKVDISSYHYVSQRLDFTNTPRSLVIALSKFPPLPFPTKKLQKAISDNGFQ